MTENLDVDAAARRLTMGESTDSYEDLLAIGRSGIVKYRPLVESFIENPSDPMLASLALSILTVHWGVHFGFLEDYAVIVERYAKGVEWDVGRDVQSASLSASAYLIDKPKYMGLLSIVVSTYKNTEENECIRDEAYQALALSTGVDIRRFLTASGRSREKDNCEQVMQEIETRLRTWKSV